MHFFLVKSMEWRRQYRVNTILEEFDAPEVMSKYFSAGIVGRDKLLNPCELKIKTIHSIQFTFYYWIKQCGLFATEWRMSRVSCCPSRRKITCSTSSKLSKKVYIELERKATNINAGTMLWSNLQSFSTWRDSPCATSLTNQVCFSYFSW